MFFLQEFWLRLTYYYELAKLKVEIAIDKRDVDPEARLKASIFVTCLTVLVGVIVLFVSVGLIRTVFVDEPASGIDAGISQDSAEAEEFEVVEPSTVNTSPTTRPVTSSETTMPVFEPDSAALGANCDSNYTPCVPISASDLDCKDISTSVQVVGVDVHRFDRDGDGIGCDSN